MLYAVRRESTNKNGKEFNVFSIVQLQWSVPESFKPVSTLNACYSCYFKIIRHTFISAINNNWLISYFIIVVSAFESENNNYKTLLKASQLVFWLVLAYLKDHGSEIDWEKCQEELILWSQNWKFRNISSLHFRYNWVCFHSV